ncbi:hypothetical protein FVE85_4027 [Porphyridium purpureum]|uniref:Uncharacterized protein n=1 Tax=Porphyridium purpureum TaxID=35688 RepID=A0A5J4YT99_PORPP|nr:hypothetical protein FVE85_4027 [Porphyridium purpureum]|eukprot:POR7997..scf229_5
MRSMAFDTKGLSKGMRLKGSRAGTVYSCMHHLFTFRRRPLADASTSLVRHLHCSFRLTPSLHARSFQNERGIFSSPLTRAPAHSLACLAHRDKDARQIHPAAVETARGRLKIVSGGNGTRTCLTFDLPEDVSCAS